MVWLSTNKCTQQVTQKDKNECYRPPNHESHHEIYKPNRSLYSFFFANNEGTKALKIQKLSDNVYQHISFKRVDVVMAKLEILVC